MSTEEELKKDGITIIKQVDALSVTLIAKFVAEKFAAFFPFSRFHYHDLFVKICRLNMYIADIPEGMSEANYFYKNSSIYFKNGLSIDEMKELCVHEFLHHFQEIKDQKGNLYRLGLCDYTGIKVHGTALNEAAVQLITSKILKKQEESVKYYGIEFSTITPSYYPLLCNLMTQMAYIVGEVVLYDSTLYSNDRFKKAFIRSTSEDTFHFVEKNFDKLMDTEEKIIVLNQKLQTSDLAEKEAIKIQAQIKALKKVIQSTFFDTQNRIFTSYFKVKLNNLFSPQDIDDYRKKLFFYRNLIGVAEDYTFFDNFYTNKMAELEQAYERITCSSLIAYKKHFWQILFGKIAKLFGIKKNSEVVNEDSQL